MDTKKLKPIINKYNVLYVEDDPEVLVKSAKLFHELFLNVDTAIDGVEALKLYNKYYEQNNRHYDIVISDIKMPNMDGTTLSKKIRKINDKQNIIIISAHNESDILQNLINIGITYFIHKPINLEELVEVIIQISQEIEKDNRSKEQYDEVIKLNEEFEALFSGYDNLIIASRTDLNGVITYVSKGFERISGYTANELIGNSHSMIRHPEMSEKTFKNMWQTIKNGKIWKGKVKNRKKNGDYYWTKTSVAPYFDTKGNILGYNSIREDITNQIKLHELHKKIDLLLSHANDGYMLIDSNLQIQEGYSKICLDIFEKESIDGLYIDELLFFNDTKKKRVLDKGLRRIISADEESKKELYLPLLPVTNTIGNKHIEINYKLIDENIMVIVQDVSEKAALESELEKKQKDQKMIIHIITNLDDFLEIKADFENFYKELSKISSNLNDLFIENNKEQIQTILRELHTYKGLFQQFQMVYTTTSIHNLESYITKLINNDIEIYTCFENIDIEQNFKKDLKIINDTIGKDYITEHKNHAKNKSALKKIKYHLRNLIKEPININFKLQNIISQIDLLSYINVEDITNKHISLVSNLSELLEKPLNPLILKKEKNLKVPPTFKNFFRNLVHIYKNSVDHGIEDEETRILRDKDPKGTIVCEYYYFKKHFHLIIKDDGGGVDLDKLTLKALENGIIKENDLLNFTDEQKLQLMFYDHLSTKDTSNEISGRGVGMSSLRQSCEDLGGKIEVKNYPQKGLEYHFAIPMDKLLDNYEADEYLQELIELLEAISNRTKSFFKQELSIDIIDARFVENMNLSNKINTTIDLINGKETTNLFFSYTDKIVKRFAQIYFKDIFDEDDFEKEVEEYSKEMINTLVGLAIQDFPPKYIDGMLGTPKNIPTNELDIYDLKGTEKILTILIQTNYGNMICKLIHDK